MSLCAFVRINDDGRRTVTVWRQWRNEMRESAKLTSAIFRSVVRSVLWFFVSVKNNIQNAKRRQTVLQQCTHVRKHRGTAYRNSSRKKKINMKSSSHSSSELCANATQSTSSSSSYTIWMNKWMKWSRYLAHLVTPSATQKSYDYRAYECDARRAASRTTHHSQYVAQLLYTNTHSLMSAEHSTFEGFFAHFQNVFFFLLLSLLRLRLLLVLLSVIVYPPFYTHLLW